MADYDIKRSGRRRRSPSYGSDAHSPDRRARRRDERRPDRRPRDLTDEDRETKRPRHRRRSGSPRAADDRSRRRRSSHDRNHDFKRQRTSYSHSRSPSPQPPPSRIKPERHRSSPPPPPRERSHAPLPSQEQSYKGTGNNPASASASGTLEKPDAIEKQLPNFNTSGKLAAETNTVSGIVLKYNEPPEARKPPSKDAWRLYIFKGSEMLETVELGGRSCWLVGRERVVVDMCVEHPSCSKQHAVLQFRFVSRTSEFGDREGRVRPYIIDLESANGTMVNGDKIPASRYVELRDKDMIQFGLSTREYVLMLPPG
ncbi:MAG: hypothetical protein M1827_000087 [Pycnora praestabilis]|nr:MAG: hypothetical protein M1827_000087 [Pycnora praestabilis]